MLGEVIIWIDGKAMPFPFEKVDAVTINDGTSTWTAYKKDKKSGEY